MIDGLLQGSPTCVCPLTDVSLIYQRPSNKSSDVTITLTNTLIITLTLILCYRQP